MEIVANTLSHHIHGNSRQQGNHWKSSDREIIGQYTQLLAVDHAEGGGQTYNFTYGYNLAGALTSEQLPSGRSLTTAYDAAGRPTTLRGTLSGTTTNYGSVTQYWPHGAVFEMGYGNNVWRDLFANWRLQPIAYWDTIGEDPNQHIWLEYPRWVNVNGRNNGTLQSRQVYAGAPAPWTSLPNVTESFSLRQPRPSHLAVAIRDRPRLRIMRRSPSVCHPGKLRRQHTQATIVRSALPSPCTKDPTGANFHTNYSYLNNTVTATQGTQTRQFVSDTRKRLMSHPSISQPPNDGMTKALAR